MFVRACVCSLAMLTSVSSCLQAGHAVKHIVGANVAGEGLDGVLSKACGASEVDQKHVEAHSDQEGVAGEEGGRVTGVGSPVGHQDGASGLLCPFVADKDCFNRQIGLVARFHLKNSNTSSQL